MKVGRIEQLSSAATPSRWTVHPLAGRDRCAACGLSRLDHEYTQDLARHRREGVIEGLRMALEIAQRAADRQDAESRIRAEIEKLRGA